MTCPHCAAPAAPGQRFCGHCGRPIAQTAALPPTWGGVDLRRWPHVLAVPLAEYAREIVPYVKLHRLTDAAEMLTRFCTTVVLADLLGQNPQEGFPDTVRTHLVEKLDRPTFGAWRDLLEASVKALSKQRQSCLVPELPGFVQKHLLPLLADLNPLAQRPGPQRPADAAGRFTN